MEENKTIYIPDIEAAKHLGVSLSTVRAWRRNKVGPPYIKTDTGLVRYTVSDLDEYMQKSKVIVNQP